MKKKIKIFIFIGIIIILVIIGIIKLYNIYSLNNPIIKSTSTLYNFDINHNSNVVVLEANESKIVMYQIKNSNKKNLKYGVGYTNGSNIEVNVFNNSPDKKNGIIKKGDTKFIKLKVINNTSIKQETVLSTIYGYKHSGKLKVPDNISLVEKGTN